MSLIISIIKLLETKAKVNREGDLRFVNLKPEDAGTYECYIKASNQSDQVSLIVEAERKTISFPSENEIEARLGQTVHQTCTSMTDGDDLQLNWFKVKGGKKEVPSCFKFI